jgi:Ca2+-binding EF-hand superfamily protein
VQKNALSNLRAAFSVLDVENNGVIYKPQMLLLFTELNEHIAAIKHIPKEKQDVMLSVLDVSGDQEWDLDEFLGFVAVLQIEFESEENLKGLVEHSFPSV